MNPVIPALLSAALGFGLSRLMPAPPAGRGTAPPSAPVRERTEAAARHSAAGGHPEGKPEGTAPDWQAAARAWMAEDPAGFHRWLLRRGMAPDARVTGDLFRAWAKKDPEAAMRAAFNLPQDFNRGLMALNIVMETAINQPGGLERVLKWAPAAEEQLQRWGWAKSEWVKSAPPEEIGAMLAGSANGEKYSGALTAYFAGHWAGRDLPAALAWMRSLPADLRSRASEGIMSQWAQTDPAAALEYLAGQASSAERGEARDALAALAKTDPRAAVEWGDKNLGLADSMGGIFGTWCAADSGEAKAYALAIEDPELRARALSSWGNHAEPGDVQTAAAELPEGRDRRMLLDALSIRGGSDEAMAFLHKEMEKGSPSISSQAALYGGRMRAYQGEETAFAWAATLPERLRTPAVTGVFDNWKNKAAAALAVERLPGGPFKTAAGEALGKSLARSTVSD